MSIYLKSLIYINKLPPVIIHFPPFINHLKINLQVIAPFKGFCLVRGMPECTTEFSIFERHSCLSWTFQIQFYFTGKRQRKSTRKDKEKVPEI